MENTDKQIPKEVAAAISNRIKFLEKTEKDFLDERKKAAQEKDE